MQELTEFDLGKSTVKILILKDQMGQNIIEIGKTLIEVKNNLEHGEFLNWLENEVDFSRYTANRFIKIATEFSNVAPVQHLGTRKLFALAGLEEEERQEVMQENNVEEMTARELEQVVREKKELVKQIEAEQEYSNELQEAIRGKERKIQALENEIKNVQPEIIEKEVVKEIIPSELLEEKESLENEVKELKKRAEKAEDTIRSIRLESNTEKEHTYYTANLDILNSNVREFIKNNSKYTYLKEDLQNLEPKRRKFVEQSVNSMKEWVMLMEQALDNRYDVVGNIIYGEGETINE